LSRGSASVTRVTILSETDSNPLISLVNNMLAEMRDNYKEGCIQCTNIW